MLYLSLEGGGYDSIARNQLGLLVWTALGLGVLVGALPVRRPGRTAWVALGLLAAYVGWTALSFTWTESSERTATDLGRVAVYLGVFALALFARGSKGARRMVAAVGSAIAVISLIAVASRLHPGWFPSADETAQVLPSARNRLAFPLNYWNGLAILIAIGLPPVLHLATSARSIAARALAAGALPAMALAVFFTLSRGGAIAAVAGLVVYVAFTSDRLPRVLTLLAAGAGGAVLIAAATQRDALESGLMNDAARDQGNELLAITIVVCLAVALFQAVVSLGLTRGGRPSWTVPSRDQAAWGLAAAVVIGIVAALTLGAPGAVSDAWGDFKSSEGPGHGTSRFESFRGNGRYQYWSSTLDENATDPLVGTGSGTFEYWWARNGDIPGFVRDAHSLYLETIGELGIVGFALIVAFLVTILATGVNRTVRAARQRRSQLAAPLAGCTAFCVAGIYDWGWELAVIPIAFLLLGSAVVTAGDPGDASPEPSYSWPARLAVAAVTLAAAIAIAIPLSSASLIRQSQDDVNAGDLPSALEAARSAQNVQPYAATPRLQQALVLELQGRLREAAVAARAAADREATNWRTWITLSRIEAEQGHVEASIDAYRRARGLNPRSRLFE